MPKITSHNSQPAGLIRQLFLPNPLQMALYVLSSLLVLTAANVRAIWNYLNHIPVGGRQAVDMLADDSSGSNLLSGISHSRFSQIVFWVIVGSVIYTVIWFLKNIFTNLRNDIIADEFVHPRSYSRIGYWGSVLGRKLLFGLICVILIFFLYAGFKLLPSLSSSFFSAIYHFEASKLVDLLGSVLALAVLLHVLFVLIRLTANSWRFIHADL